MLEGRRKILASIEEFRTICKSFDDDGSGTISRKEFMDHMQNPDVVCWMANADLEVHDVDLFFRVVAGSDEDVDIPIGDLVHGCMAMRGSASSLDMQKQLFLMTELR